jgi:tRNA pseudouridine55 synthase
MARKGIEVERKARLIHIYSFCFSAYNEPYGQFRIACTKGTYVRSLAHEIGLKVGCGAHLSALRRTVSGKFDVKDSIPFEEVLKLSSADLQKRILPFLTLAQTH